MEVYYADLHVHTALSPCAEREMSPPAIAMRARSREIRLLGICDHNSAANVPAVIEAARALGVAVLAGMEVQTREDVHVLTFFGELETLLHWQDEVYAALPDRANDEARLGEQLVMDSAGRVTGRETRLLLSSISMGVEALARRVHELGGMVVPAHVDRPSFSLVRHLGFVPPGLGPDCIEVSWRTGARRAREAFPQLSEYPIIVSSDAHRLDEIDARTAFFLEAPSFEEVRLALRGAGGREAHPVDEIPRPLA